MNDENVFSISTDPDTIREFGTEQFDVVLTDAEIVTAQMSIRAALFTATMQTYESVIQTVLANRKEVA